MWQRSHLLDTSFDCWRRHGNQPYAYVARFSASSAGLHNKPGARMCLSRKTTSQPHRLLKHSIVLVPVRDNWICGAGSVEVPRETNTTAPHAVIHQSQTTPSNPVRWSCSRQRGAKHAGLARFIKCGMGNTFIAMNMSMASEDSFDAERDGCFHLPTTVWSQAASTLRPSQVVPTCGLTQESRTLLRST